MIKKRFVHHPTVWRNRAILARLTAEHLADVKEMEHQLRLAALYERLAQYAEERLARDRDEPLDAERRSRV